MRRSPRNLRIAYDHRGLTHFGGIHFFHEFLRVLQLRRFLTQNLEYPRPGERPALRYTIEGSATVAGGGRVPFRRSGELGERGS